MFGGLRVKRGVYRFQSHDEADAWLWQAMTRPRFFATCRELNTRGARYVVVGGFAIRAAGYVRRTVDIDLLMATDPDNEARGRTQWVDAP